MSGALTGARFWNDPRNLLLKQYFRALEVMRPKWFSHRAASPVMENVEGLLTANKGYKVRVDKVYAHEYGVPQRRKRTLIVGNRLGYRSSLPAPQYHATGRIYRQAGLTLYDAISALPQPAEKINMSSMICRRRVIGKARWVVLWVWCLIIWCPN